MNGFILSHQRRLVETQATPCHAHPLPRYQAVMFGTSTYQNQRSTSSFFSSTHSQILCYNNRKWSKMAIHLKYLAKCFFFKYSLEHYPEITYFDTSKITPSLLFLLRAERKKMGKERTSFLDHFCHNTIQYCVIIPEKSSLRKGLFGLTVCGYSLSQQGSHGRKSSRQLDVVHPQSRMGERRTPVFSSFPHVLSVQDPSSRNGVANS